MLKLSEPPSRELVLLYKSCHVTTNCCCPLHTYVRPLTTEHQILDVGNGTDVGTYIRSGLKGWLSTKLNSSAYIRLVSTENVTIVGTFHHPCPAHSSWSRALRCAGNLRTKQDDRFTATRQEPAKKYHTNIDFLELIARFSGCTFETRLWGYS